MARLDKWKAEEERMISDMRDPQVMVTRRCFGLNILCFSRDAPLFGSKV